MNAYRLRIVDGVTLPPVALPTMDERGLDLWLSTAGSAWVDSVLRGRTVTVSIESDCGTGAWLVLCLRRVLPGVGLASSFPYGVVFGEQRLFWTQWPAIRTELRRLGIACLELALIDPVRDVGPRDWLPKRAMLDAGRQQRQVLALDPNHDPSISWPASIRWALRKAQRMSAHVVPLTVPADIAHAQRLYVQTMREKGAPAYYGEERLRLIAETLQPRGAGILYLGYVGDTPAGMIAATDGSAVRQLVQLAVPRAYQDTRLADLLVATAILDAWIAGRRYFDFLATPSGDAGLRQFKEKWGATSYPITLLRLDTRPLRAALIDAARLASRFTARHVRRR